MNKKTDGHQAKTDNVNDITDRRFVYPAIPDGPKPLEERRKYLLVHYWDHFDFNDTSYIHKPEISEQAFVDFIDILYNVSLPVASEAINELMLRASVNWDMHNFIIDLFEKYLYDPNSPFRNEELYIPVLEFIKKSPTVRTEDLITAEYRLKMAQKNRTGMQATDFIFMTGAGRLKKLSDIKNDYILLYFNNPGCQACRQTAKRLLECPGSKDPRLTILALYPDEDLTEWKKLKHEIPGEWINGYSPGGEIMKKQLYDLKALPTLYLLDSKMKVLLKDAPIERIVEYLDNKFAYNLIKQ